MRAPRRPGVPGALRPVTLLVVLALGLAACGDRSTTASSGALDARPIVIGAIPDQDPEKLARLHGGLSRYLSERLGRPVVYQPVTDYTAAVNLFRTGDLDLVWFGGLTGVQARLQVPGSRAVAQRDIDAEFRSVFVASTSTDIRPFEQPAGLRTLAGRRFTFGSESSTSGRLMPQWFLAQAGVRVADFQGPPGFSGSHDRTIALVASGSYEVGVLNEQVWNARVADGTVDQSRLRVVFRTPPYHDYHWVLRPELAADAGFVERLMGALTGLDPAVPAQREILDLFGAARFVPTEDARYAQIEQVGREIGLLR